MEMTLPNCEWRADEGATVREMLGYVDFDINDDVEGGIRVYYDERSDDGDKIVKVLMSDTCECEFGAGRHYSWSEALTDCVNSELDTLENNHKMKIDPEQRRVIISDVFTFLNDKGFGEEIFKNDED